jgi:trans-2,3-dihydro-3-hydroxyanthranilate isomerase
MGQHRYQVVDVFTKQALEGNPLAVFPAAAGIDDQTMQKIAKELNLSETVFIVPASRPGCDVGVRIFTPMREMLFAGHPTVGASFVLMTEGIVPKDATSFVLDEKIGPVPIRVERTDSDGRPLIWLKTPPISFKGSYDPAGCAEALGLDPSDMMDIAPGVVTAGNPNLYIPVKDRAAVDRSWLDMGSLRKLRHAGDEDICVFVFTPVPEGAYSRMFAPEHGVAEDPATGSATGPLAAYMIRHGLASGAPGTRFVSEQGTKMGRRSLLHILVNGQDGADGIEVGGYVTPLVEAKMSY